MQLLRGGYWQRDLEIGQLDWYSVKHGRSWYILTWQKNSFLPKLIFENFIRSGITTNLEVLDSYPSWTTKSRKVILEKNKILLARQMWWKRLCTKDFSLGWAIFSISLPICSPLRALVAGFRLETFKWALFVEGTVVGCSECSRLPPNVL